MYVVASNWVPLSACSEFSQSIPRDFVLHYDPYGQSVKVLNTEFEIKEFARDLKQQMELLSQSVEKIFVDGHTH